MKVILTFLLLSMLLASHGVEPKPLFQFSCFVYHRIGDARFPSTNCSTIEFEAHIEYLKKNNYQVLTAADAIKKTNQNMNISSKTVVITFDDAYKSIENAIKILDRNHFTATIYINPLLIGNSEYLSWDELRELQSRGYEIGNHSLDHTQFLSISDEKQRSKVFNEDLVASNKFIKDKLKNSPKTYAYPFGEYTPEMAKNLEKEGYYCAFVQHSGTASNFNSKFEIPRFSMTGVHTSLERFKMSLSMKPVQTSLNQTTFIENSSYSKKINFDIYSSMIPKSMQLFINGNKTENINFKDNHLTINSIPLKTRRTKATITMQSNDGTGNWHWLTLLFVNPQLPE